MALASNEFAVGPTCHITNGDEENVPLFAGQYHKTLPHDEFGQVRVRVQHVPYRKNGGPSALNLTLEHGEYW